MSKKKPEIQLLPNGVRIGIYEPSNSTRYSAIAVPMIGHVNCGWLGSVTNGWLVVSGMSNTRGYFMAKKGPIHISIAQEKFGLHGIDAECFTILLRSLLDR